MKDFKGLAVWRKAHDLTVIVYKVIGRFPKEETYGLQSQLRRSCASVPANIAEGCGREGDAELARFFRIAMGSASETQYHFILARDVGLLNDGVYGKLSLKIEEIKRMLFAFIKKLKADR
jgi:four helix bundle protein